MSRYRSQLREEFRIFGLIEASFLTAFNGAKFGSTGAIINCRVVFRLLYHIFAFSVGVNSMKSSLFTGLVLVGLVTVGDASLKILNPQSSQASAQEMMKGPTDLPLQKKVDLITKHKGELGGGDELRRFFFGDLMPPIAVQPGGANMIVLLYNQANDYTFACCATYDVVVALKKGKVTKFDRSEVK